MIYRLERIGHLLFLVALFLVPMFSHAEGCGSIVQTYDPGDGNIQEYSNPITNCANPFWIDATTTELSITFGDTLVEDNNTYPFLDETSHEWKITGQTFFADGMLYLHRGSDYVEKKYIENGDSYTFLEGGTYTLVINRYPPMQVRSSPIRRFFELIIPTAWAGSQIESRIITFTVTDVLPEPVGISNILFLPGIQASRLYTEIDGEEEKIWEPFGDDDFNYLAMNENGESERDVYIKDVVDELYGFSSMSIYKKFITFLNAVDDDMGPMVRTFPYDWRYDVFEIVENGTKDDSGLIKKPIETIEYLASLSPTKKVTLIGHSNGGLLAKAIMLKLEEEGKSHLIDKIIFIGTPHIGTPKALATVLHGYDQEHASGIISDDAVARRVMKNMPGVYGLLPSEAYIESLSDPLISFDDSEMTSLFRNKYGFTVTNLTEYTDFLNGVEGRVDAENRINEPTKVNTTMLDNALQKHRDLDTWTVPEGVEVHNIVGTGLPTPKLIEYRAFDGLRCYAGYQCVREKEIEPVLNFSGYGDKTVMSKSAGFLDVNNLYIDLSKIEKFNHANITEADTTQILIDHLLHGSSTNNINFVSPVEPISNVELEVVSIHSPARMYLRDSSGNVTGKTSVDGKWLMEIEGSTYLEAGNVKYVIVPKSTSYEVIIEGEGSGFFTTVIHELHGDVEHEVHRFTATTSSTTIATFEKSNGEFSPISIDEDGNGIIDMELTVDGVIIEKPATYSNLRSVISNLTLLKIHKEILLQFAKGAESLHLMKKNNIHAQAEKVLLSTLDKTIVLYERKKLISVTESEKIRKIINSLISQIVWEKKN
jgi:hypothetical protein